jgi:DNA-binding transcriptional MocR family regulator
MSTSAETISFARGAPSLDIVDLDGLRNAAIRAFDEDPAGIAGYGTAIGYPALREWIAARHGVSVDQVIVTNGSLQGDAFVFEQLVHAGDAVVVEAPTYDRTLLNLKRLGAEVRPVALEGDGIDTDQLRQELEAGVRPTLAHIIPNFQNPAGYTLSEEKRRELLALAKEYGFYIFEDDPYIDVRFEGEPLPTMLSLDDADRVIYASSFSKTICPGVRVGYLIGPKELIAEITKLATWTYISPSMFAQATVNQFCRSESLANSISGVKVALHERRDTLVAALKEHLPQAQFLPPQGGYFMWVELPEEVDVSVLEPIALEHGVSFVKGTDFLLEGGKNCMRLAYSGVTPDQIRTGIERLAAAIAALRVPV